MTLICCSECGKQISENAVVCPECGNPLRINQNQGRVSDKSFIATILLCIFFGTIGVHRFYVGKIGTGILQLITFGGLGIWSLIDLIIIIVGKFTDKSGAYIRNN